MSARRKPLWRWEPMWYIVLFVLIFVTSALQVAGSPTAFAIFLALTIAVALWMITTMIVGAARGPRNPDASGNLTSLDRLHMLPVDATEVAPTVVGDTRRHQSAIDAAAAFGGDTLSAVLVPESSRWMGIRLRVSVQLVAGERVFLAGYLPVDMDAEWNDLLLTLRERGLYVRVPAAVRGGHRPFTVDVDLGAAEAAIRKAYAQRASS